MYMQISVVKEKEQLLWNRLETDSTSSAQGSSNDQNIALNLKVLMPVLPLETKAQFSRRMGPLYLLPQYVD